MLDRPETAQLARAAAEAAGMADRFEALSGDFFIDVPESDYYVLKLVLHDWDDVPCREILGNCRRSARPESRQLVVEALIGEGAADGSRVDLGAMMDMTILALVPGRERRLSEYDALLTSAADPNALDLHIDRSSTHLKSRGAKGSCG